MSVVNSPSPVPWNAGPGTTAICSGIANVWRFNAVFSESGGVAVTLTSVTNVVDGTAQPVLPAQISIPANGSATLPRELCFTTSTQHTLQSTFTGTDSAGRSVTVNAPQVVLSAT